MTYAGVSGDATRGISGGLHAQLARRVGVGQVALQHALLDHHGAARGHALIVERRGAEQPGNRAVVDHRQILRRHFLAKLASQERRVAIDRFAVHRFEDVAQQRAGRARLEDYRNFLRLHLHRAQTADRALGGDAADVRRLLQTGVAARQREPVIALHRFTLARHRNRAKRTTAGAIVSHEAARIGEYRPG